MYVGLGPLRLGTNGEGTWKVGGDQSYPVPMPQVHE